jgi:hypothetical protein
MSVFEQPKPDEKALTPDNGCEEVIVPELFTMKAHFMLGSLESAPFALPPRNRLTAQEQEEQELRLILGDTEKLSDTET